MSINKPDFINRDLSWLSFNARVLQEAEDTTVPLLERLRFLGIYSSNRDEFYRVRVATIRRMKKFGKKGKLLIGADPGKLLEKIQEVVVEQQDRFDKIYNSILDDLKSENIFIVNEYGLDKQEQKFVSTFFDERVSPYLIPIMVDSAPKFPYLKDRMIYLAIRIIRHGKDGKTKYALIEVPTDVLPRFIVLPKSGGTTSIILLDDIIRFSLKNIFSIFNYDKIDAYSISITRDSELDIDTDISKSFIEKISKSVKQRTKGEPVRFMFDESIPDKLLTFLLKNIKLKDSDIIPGGRYHNFRDFMNFPKVGASNLLYEPTPHVDHARLSGVRSYLKAIHKKDIMLSYPYHTFNHIAEILREAAIDPKVDSIKVTLYRLANNSNIVNALVNAVRNGKQVTAVVELQARFDEEVNIYYSNKLQEEGVHVIFGVPGLKVHTKMFLITSRENNKIVQYAHIGTGNFNENTATIYADHALLTSNPFITREVEKLFNFYQNNYKTGSYKHLIVSPFNSRKRFKALLANEIKNAKAGKNAWMILKMNSLSDVELVDSLYEASKAGVKIDLIVRGICALVPQLKNKSENIRVISIVDRFLEHSRIYIFCNDDSNKYYISSGDWMSRNLDYRSEVTVPIFDSDIQKDLNKYIQMQLSDNCKARLVNSGNEENAYFRNRSRKTRAQASLNNWIVSKAMYKVAHNGNAAVNFNTESA